MKRLLLRLNRFPWLLLLLLIFAEISVIFLVFQYRILAFLFNSIIFSGQVIGLFTRLLLWIAILILIRAFAQFTIDILSKHIAIQIKTDLRNDVLKKTMRLGASDANQRKNLQVLLVEGIESIDTFFSQYIPQIIFSFFVPLTILIFVLRLDLLSGAVLLITAPLLPLFMVLIGKYAEKSTKKQWHLLNQMSAFFLDSIRGIRALKVLGQSENHQKRIRKVSQDYNRVTLSVLRVTFISAFALEFISTLSTAIIAVEIGLRVLYGRLLFEQAFFILLIAPEFYLPLRNLGLKFHSAMSAIQAANSIFSYLTVQENLPSVTSPLLPLDLRSNKAIAFDDVFARYPAANEDVLTGVSFEIPIGQQTAIIGPSGAGKSTIFQILLRYLNPHSGNVSLDNKNVLQYDLQAWRGQLSWVSQNVWLFNGTILENIRIAKPGASIVQVRQAIAQAHLGDLIDALPYHLETKLSETGNRLSTGQRQRISLARAFLRDTPVLLLDEPTAFLDPFLEESLHESIMNLTQGRTVVTIAHRLHTIIWSDRIILMNEGCVAAQGTHESLQKSSTLYRKIVSAYFGVVP